MLFFHSTVVVLRWPLVPMILTALASVNPNCPGALQLEDTPRSTYPLVSVPPPYSPPATASSSSHSSPSVQPKSSWFKFATEDEFSTFAEGLVPENTTRSTSLDPRPFWTCETRRVWGPEYTKWTLNMLGCLLLLL